MALQTIKGTQNIPPGAVKISQKEALDFQKKLVRDWKTGTDVFFLRYSKHLASVLVAATSYATWDQVSKMFNLGKPARINLMAPGTLIPVAVSLACFNRFVTNDVLLMKNKCPFCYQFPYGLIQMSMGVFQPLLCGIIIGLAQSPKLPDMPDSKTQTKKFFRHIFHRIVKPGAVKLNLFCSFHVLSLIFLPYMQTKELCSIMTQLKNKGLLEESK